MRALGLMLLATTAGMLVVPAADAHPPHTVVLGETLWWIAAQNDVTTRTVAAYDGLAPEANVVLGGTIKVPTPAEGAAALADMGTISSAAPPPPPPIAAPPASGAYVVRAGDTLSALAAPTAISAERLAFVNGLDPAAILAIGTVLRLPGNAPATAPAAESDTVTRIVTAADPAPAPGTLSAVRIMQLAAEQGAPASLAAAIAWQESGFDNAAVSSANARGVMQVLPGTWDWVRANLTSAPLSPGSAEDNVRAGSLYLARLLRDTGGDERLAIAAYYQGLWSVRSRGMFDDTRRYVDGVLAMRERFAGL